MEHIQWIRCLPPLDKRTGEQAPHRVTCHVFMTVLDVQAHTPVQEVLRSVHDVTETLRGLFPEVGTGTS